MEDNKYDTIKISSQLCFPLYVCAKDIVRRYTPYLNKINLTYTQYVVMMAMWEHRKLNITDLGNYVHLDSGALTPLLKKLENKGYILREKSRIDERSKIISITKKGLSLRDEAVNIHKKMGRSINISKEEFDLLYSLLYKVIDNKDLSEE